MSEKIISVFQRGLSKEKHPCSYFYIDVNYPEEDLNLHVLNGHQNLKLDTAPIIT